MVLDLTPLSLDTLPVVVARCAGQGRPRPSPRWAGAWEVGSQLRSLVRHHWRVEWAALLLPWLLYIQGDSGLGPGLHDLAWVRDQQLLLGLGLLVIAISGVAALRDHLRSGGGAGPLLAALALILWHLGLQARGTPDKSSKWCLAVVRAKSGSPSLPIDHRHAAVGLMLLDDMIRAILHFAAGAPLEAWPFALTGRQSYFLWLHDEEWWEACYRKSSWMSLPKHPRHSRSSGLSSFRLLLTEALLCASMAVETLGTMVILPPKCAGNGWVAAPCLALTAFVVSCAPWLPRQSDLVLMDMLQLMRIVSRFAIYFQAVWIVLMGLLIQPDDLALCALPKDHPAFLALQATAVVVLYSMVASHLWVVTTRCRVASPLYAVPAEDIVEDASLRCRPLYCGSLGLVEGSYAPTRMCDWEEPSLQRCVPKSATPLPPFPEDGASSATAAATDGLRCWRDRYSLRRCAEMLAAREAHLLSHLDALDLRTREADFDAQGASPQLGGARARSRSAALRGCGGWLHGSCALATCALAACAVALASSRGWAWRVPPCGQHGVVSSPIGGGSALEAVLLATLFLRVAHYWYSLVLQGAMRSWDPTGSRASQQEVDAMRQQALALHSRLAETQWLLCRLEARLNHLRVATQRPKETGVWAPPQQLGAMRVLLIGWLSSVLALIIVPHFR